jgi:predicted exporter
VLLAAACVVLVVHRDTLWDDNIASLSPVSKADIALDTRLRADMGAADVRYLVVASGPDRESVLNSAEQVSTLLQTQVEQGELASFESPSRYLPSTATQRARQDGLPSRDVLESRMQQAVQGMPVRAPLFTPFLDDVEKARQQPLLQAADLEQTSMAMAIDALLIPQNQGEKKRWSALLPLTAPKGGEINAAKISAALAATQIPNVLFVDLKHESDSLYSGYLHEAILLSLGGVLAIVVLLLFVCRSPRRVLRLIAPLAAAVITVTAGLTLLGQALILLHLVGLLLVVAVGSNYALFFDQNSAPNETGSATSISPRTLASMLLANLTTVAGFGLLAFSKVSILNAMGATVAPGVILALLYAAIFARTNRDRTA